MMNKLLDCRFLQAEVKDNVRAEIAKLDIKPSLQIVQVGDNPDSNKYVAQKIKHCTDVGIEARLSKFASCTTEELISCINYLNEDEAVNGIIVQLPLPSNIDTRKVLDSISPLKDVDCLTTVNMGMLVQGRPFVEPCTPLGIVKLLERIEYSLVGQDVLMIGRSEIVGKPLSSMLTTRNATVTLAHSKTKDLQSKINNADIIITAIGKAKYIKVSNPNALVIDVGINFEDGKLVGDFNADQSTFEMATKVPNGVGALTTSMVCHNTIQLYKRQHNLL